jgi:hypothetical protein
VIDPSNPEAARAPAPAPTETLMGDRLCMKCMHPLVGSPITRDGPTGLLYVRCGECGTPSALFEYPTVGPWIKRMKSVAAASIIAIALIVTLVAGGVTFGFSLGAGEVGGETAGSILVERYRELGGKVDDQTWSGSAWGQADLKWLDTDAGRRELAAVRWSAGPILMILTMCTIGSLVLAPFAATLGIMLMRRPLLQRALFTATILGAAAVAAMLFASVMLAPRGAPSWYAVASTHHAAVYSLCAGSLLALSAAAVATVAPRMAAAVARFVLPPSDRRLVAWLWEWRGKAVPRD